MLPDLVSNPGPLTYESGALPIAQRGPAIETMVWKWKICNSKVYEKMFIDSNSIYVKNINVIHIQR